MGKKILKEMFIIALLVIVIVIVLIGLLYDYIPTEQSVETLPEPIEYMADSTVTAALQEIEENESTYNLQDTTSTNTNTTSLLKSYTIDKSDLKNYEARNAFESGKVDPFSDYQEPVSNTVTNTTNTTGGGTTVTNTTTTPTNTTNANTGTFFEKSNSK